MAMACSFVVPTGSAPLFLRLFHVFAVVFASDINFIPCLIYLALMTALSLEFCLSPVKTHFYRGVNIFILSLRRLWLSWPYINLSPRFSWGTAIYLFLACLLGLRHCVPGHASYLGALWPCFEHGIGKKQARLGEHSFSVAVHKIPCHATNFLNGIG